MGPVAHFSTEASPASYSLQFTTEPKVHMLFGLSCHACQPEVMCTWKNTILRLVIFFITLLKSFSLALFYTSVIERLNEISTYGIQRNYF